VVVEQVAAPIIVLDPDVAEARQIASWLRSAGLGKVAVAGTPDEALFLLGRRNALLLIVDDRVAIATEQRVLRHIARNGHALAPAIVRLRAASAAARGARADKAGAEDVQRPLDAHNIVLGVGAALQRPDLLKRMDRDRDQSAVHLETARRMQLALLPTERQIADVEAECEIRLAGFCQSGEAVGGDFWGVWPTAGGCFALALADFAGHGLSAALNTFRLHAILQEDALPRANPVLMTELLNQRLHALLQRGQYATIIYAHVDPGRRVVEWCSAGGPPPLFVARSGATDLQGRGLPLGMRADTSYTMRRTELPAAGILCMFSDGLYEGGADHADIDRADIAAALMPASAKAANGQLEEAARDGIEALKGLCDRHERGEHSDDVMAVCVGFGDVRKEAVLF
jgi:sigma-B regulation protein RsbU (phosphoserine phosphatase)